MIVSQDIDKATERQSAGKARGPEKHGRGPFQCPAGLLTPPACVTIRKNKGGCCMKKLLICLLALMLAAFPALAMYAATAGLQVDVTGMEL